ncbi:MBL fold metallo-hydrolase [Orenia metallireducens]|uniref:MBL fold metallo-hydrolase n=1 Tax=Orenia metallireducens TaxID=1413210 RepID=A0A1C0ABC2_9FIRM|nr:MBL fold metallo-hydrolase [Orenia metallireducens]OCL27685.1 MBL fold metallo-hydrolase [Orenia metallireducens]
MKITFLGTGTSHGVPVIGCECPTCISEDSKNKRYRSSIYIEVDNTSLLIDTPPELRLQLLENNIRKVDAVLFTHPHADHLMGFDDLRGINRLQSSSIPCYGNKMTIEEIEKVFSYILNPIQIGGGIPQVTLHKVNTEFEINSNIITPIPVKHGGLDIFGYRIDKFAYLTDCSYIPENSFTLLEGIKLLVIDALRYRSHSTHMNIEEALKIADRLGVSKAYFTHLSHDLEYNKVNSELPDHVKLAYDGLQLVINSN